MYTPQHEELKDNLNTYTQTLGVLKIDHNSTFQLVSGGVKWWRS